MQPLLFANRNGIRKAATFAAPGPAAGEHVLGKTKRGRPVYASGAESGGYNDADHADAAELHARATAYHEKQAGAHGQMRDTDRDWKRSEEHHGESERHGKLRDHHFERTREHLIAGGRAEEADFDGKELTNRRPMDAKRVAKTKAEMAKRTQHSHPGGHNEADVAEYASYGGPAEKQ